MPKPNFCRNMIESVANQQYLIYYHSTRHNGPDGRPNYKSRFVFKHILMFIIPAIIAVLLPVPQTLYEKLHSAIAQRRLFGYTVMRFTSTDHPLLREDIMPLNYIGFRSFIRSKPRCLFSAEISVDFFNSFRISSLCGRAFIHLPQETHWSAPEPEGIIILWYINAKMDLEVRITILKCKLLKLDYTTLCPTAY